MFFPKTSADDIREVLARYAVLAPPQPPPGPADWQRLRDKLGRAAAFAPTAKGVNQHRWRPGAPRRAAEIDAQELRLGVTFPAEYRAFLRELGDAVPGPSGQLRRLSADHGDIARTRARWDGFSHLREDTGWGPFVRGALILAHRCSWGTFVLALDGPAPGTVWLALAEGGRVHPTGLGMFAWYEDWLDEVLRRIDDDDAALRACEQAVVAEPGDGAAWSRLTCEALARGREARAAEALARARALGCEPSATERAGLVVRITTLPGDAVIADRVRALLALDLPLPSFSASALRYELGDRLACVGRDAEALAILLPMVGDGSYASTTTLFNHTLADSLFATGRPAEALAIARPRGWDDLAFACLLQLGRLDEAGALLASSARLAGPGPTGHLQFKRGDLDAAERTFAALVKERWSRPQHQYWHAVVLAHRGELEAAESALHRALLAGHPFETVERDPDAEPLRATATYRLWAAG